MGAPYAGQFLTPGRFAGRVAVVTGAAQGIGQKVAERIGAEGGAVVLVDRAELVHDVAQGIVRAAEASGSGGAATSVTADLETWAGAQQAVEAALAAHGRVDVLVNNVGGTIWARPYEEYDEEKIEKEIRRSLFPTLWSCRAVLPAMLEQGSGTIVNVSSVATRGMHRVPYAAAKGGVNALTQSLAGSAWSPPPPAARGPRPAGSSAAPRPRAPRSGPGTR
jgi:dihydroxycyclohexadiene carboxylate dehydrogenase